MTFFDCTADLVGQLNGNGQKGMLQIAGPYAGNKMGVFFVKKVEMVFLKWTFPQRRVQYVQYQYCFYFRFYLFGGAYAPNGSGLTHPLSKISSYATGRNSHIISRSFLSLAAVVLVGLDSSSKGV